jgi:hypothetical protein
MQTKTELNFSLRNVPDSWNHAAEEAPEADNSPLRRKRLVGQLPQRYDVDVLSATVAGVAMAVVSGAAWYFLEIRNAMVTPWLAAVLGLVIAMAARLGAGRHHPEVRATISVIVYLTALFTVAYMIERHQFVSPYGAEASIAGGERGLVRDRLTQPLTLLAWSVGLGITAQISYLTRRL